MGNSRGWRPTALRLAAASAVVLAGLGVTYLLRTRGLEAGANAAQLLSLLVAIAPMVSWARNPTPQQSVGTSEALENARRTLATLVSRQWREEILARQLDDPAPIGARWKLSDLDALGGSDSGSHGVFEGSARRADLFADEFRELPNRRLVILGEAGAGKTTLAMLLVRELVDDLLPREPVPVLLSMAGWDPACHTLRDWLTEQLELEYPDLCASEFGPDAAATLVADGWILPVLDGLDELPADRRTVAIRNLNANLARGDALILCCRTAAYADAIGTSQGTFLRSATVIEPVPTATNEAVEYLRACLPNRAGGGWPQVMATLADAEAPVTRALATPLVIWLVRRLYIDNGRDPVELLDRTAFPGPRAITDHLLDQLPRAVLRSEPGQPGRGRSAGYQRDPAAAERWLTFLARHTERSGRDIAWWRLADAIDPGPLARLAVGCVAGLLFAVLTAPTALLGGQMIGQPFVGLVGGSTGGFVLGVAFAFASSRHVPPASAGLGWGAERGGQLIWLLASRAVSCVLGGLVVGLVTRFWIEPASGLGGFALAGLLIGSLMALVSWVAIPMAGGSARTPLRSLRADTKLAVARTLASCLAGGFGLGLLFGLLGFWAYLLVLLAVGVVLFDRARGGQGPRIASSNYLVTVSLAALGRHLPFRLMRFLNDAHRLGLLRREGPVHQFRHLALRDRLLDRASANEPHQL